MSGNQRNRIDIIIVLIVSLLFTGCTPIAVAASEPTMEPYTAEPMLVQVEMQTAAPTPVLTPTPLFIPTPTPDMRPFSIVWLADTQTISYYDYPGAYETMGQWIVDEKENENIRFVVQTGDAVDNGFKESQWQAFDAMYNQFRDELPYFPIAGNHDLGVKLGDYSAYLQRPYVESIPRANSFERGRAVYATFTAGGTKFLLLGAGWESEELAMDWMNQVLRAHRDYVAILLFHSYINADGTFSKHGREIYEQLVVPNSNVRLVLSGHVNGTGIRVDEIDDNGDGNPDRSVNAMIYNYQSYGKNCGQIRLLTFDPADRSIRVITYSPYTQKYFADGYFQTAEFVLEDSF